MALTDFARLDMNYKTKWIWITGGGFEGNQHISYNFTYGINSFEGSYTSDYFKFNDKFVKMESLVFEHDKKDIEKEWKIFTHQNFKGK